MKKLVLGSVACLSLSTLVFLSCQKENNSIQSDPGISPGKANSKSGPEVIDKVDGISSCSISCFWGSCSVSCRGGRNGSLGAATCNCIGIGPLGMFGSMASCTCGHAGVSVRGIHVGPEIVFDEINIENFVFLNELIAGIENVKINQLKGSLQALINSAEHPNGQLRAERFNRFLDDMAEVEFDDAAYIRPHLLNRAAACGRDL